MNLTKNWLGQLFLTLTLSLSLITCSNTLAQEPLPEGAVVVETEKLTELQNFARDCRDFSVACQRRAGLLEAYKAEADKLIEHQSIRNAQINDELSSEKRKNHILYPLLGIAAGFLGGAFLIKK